jgi:hypothetical protein
VASKTLTQLPRLVNNPNSLTGNRKPSAKNHVPKNHPTMDTKIEATRKNGKKCDMFLEKKNISRELPPNPCTGGYHPYTQHVRLTQLRHYYSYKEYNTYPTFSHLLFSLHTGGYRVT